MFYLTLFLQARTVVVLTSGPLFNSAWLYSIDPLSKVLVQVLLWLTFLCLQNYITVTFLGINTCTIFLCVELFSES